MRYRDDGTGSALLLIHGWGLDLEVWEPQAAALAGRHRVLRHDRRGFGLSAGAPSLASDVLDVFALLDFLDVPRAVLLGASQGARVALRAAVAAPERVVALVLDAPPDELGHGRGALTDEIPLDYCRELARRGDMESVRRLWAQHPFTRLHSTAHATHAQLANILARYPGNDLLDSAPPPRLDDLGALATPALVLNGAHDLESRQAAGTALAQALPQGQHRLILDAGHLANLDQPLAYSEAVTEFIGLVESSTARAAPR